MTTPTYTVELQLVSGSYTNITNDVLQVSISRQLSYMFSGLRAGDCLIEMDNFDGNYSPDNQAGSYAGLLRPNLPIRVHATYNNTPYVLFTGYVDEFSVQPGLSDPRRSTITARDSVKKLADSTLTTSLFVNMNAGSLYHEVFTRAGITSLAVDALSDEVPYAWFRDDPATNVLQTIGNLGYYSAYVSGDGEMRVKSRYFNAMATVVGSYNQFFGLNSRLTGDRIFNNITIQSNPRYAFATSTLAWINQPILMAGSSYLSFFLEYLDPETGEPCPATNLISPVSSSDFIAFTTQTLGFGANKTSALSVNVTLFGQTAVQTIWNNDSREVWLNKYQVRGDPVVLRSRISVTVDDSSSQAIYGKLNFTLSNDLIGDIAFAQDYANFIRLRTANPFSQYGAAFRNQFPDQLTFELGDLLHLTNTVAGAASNMLIYNLQHDISLDKGVVHQTQVAVELDHEENIIIFDNASLGLLDGTRVWGF